MEFLFTMRSTQRLLFENIQLRLEIGLTKRISTIGKYWRLEHADKCI